MVLGSKEQIDKTAAAMRLGAEAAQGKGGNAQQVEIAENTRKILEGKKPSSSTKEQKQPR